MANLACLHMSLPNVVHVYVYLCLWLCFRFAVSVSLSVFEGARFKVGLKGNQSESHIFGDPPLIYIYICVSPNGPHLDPSTC